MKKYKGLFLTFEGPEASGKSSQINLLKEFFKKNKIPFVLTREPGGTILGEKLRQLILNKHIKISKLEEIFMLMAARSNHIDKVILPNLNKGISRGTKITHREVIKAEFEEEMVCKPMV